MTESGAATSLGDQLFAPVVVRKARRMPALDGMRALAVASVVLYHLDPRFLPGGFIGVDVFFVLSGYLITALLIREHDKKQAIDLRGFWIRRVRRLWPLAWIVLSAVALAGLFQLWGADAQRALGSQTAAAVGNVSNWWQLSHGGYVEEFVRPSPLRHFWSLAIEEQFYFIWPVLLIGLLALARRTTAAVVWLGLAILASCSIYIAWVLSPEDAYLNTFSRAIALLVGAALAWGWKEFGLFSGPRSRRAHIVVGSCGAAGLVTLVFLLFNLVPEQGWLHRGGFTLIALAACATVASAVTNPAATRTLAWVPLVWIGERSYAIYLIHWPLIVALGSQGTLFTRSLIVIGLSVSLAALVHRIIEQPIVMGQVSWKRLGLAGSTLCGITAVAILVAWPRTPTPQDLVQETLGKVADPGTVVASGSDNAQPKVSSPPTTVCIPVAPDAPQFGSDSEMDVATVGELADPEVPACQTQLKLLVLGDSTGRGVSNGLRAVADPRVQIWDRTQLGCSYGPEGCPDWRESWAINVTGIEPDATLIYTTVVIDVLGVDDPDFLSAEGAALREKTFTDAIEIAGSTGAKVFLASPARPAGEFYCAESNRRTSCDPSWTDAWSESVRSAAAQTGATIIEVGSWTDARNLDADRPDGLHLSGSALREHAEWLIPQLLTAQGTVKGDS
jgi:peptidoglycan/LPS O-acetylase OafA/YrhL